MGLGNGQSPGVGVRTTVAGVIGYGGTAMCVTLVFLAMRAVMDIGGSCADGGPYVSSQSCPEGSTVALLLGIFGLFGFGFLATIAGARIGGVWAGAPVYAWAALFGSLGWNFLDYGLFNAPADTGIEWGWVLCGVVFWAMAIGPLIGMVPLLSGLGPARRSGAGGARRIGGPGQPHRQSTTPDAGPPVRPAPPASAVVAVPGVAAPERSAPDVTDDVREELEDIAADFGAVVSGATAGLPADPLARRAPTEAPGSDGVPGPEFTEGTQALLDRLERLADMRDRGLLNLDQYETAKTAIMVELEGRT